MAAKPKFKDYIVSINKLKKSDELPQIMVLFGNSEFLVNDSIQTIQNLWSTTTNEPHNLIEAKSLNPHNFSELWEQSSLFASKSLNVIRRCQDNRSLHKLLKDIPEKKNIQNTHLFIFDSEKPNVHAKKELTRLGAFELNCVEPWPNEIPPLINQLAKRRKLKLSFDACNLLLDSVGSDLIKIENELNKFSMIFEKSDDELSADQIAPYLGMLRADHAFELDNLLTQSQWSKAHILLLDLLTRGESSIKILGLLTRHCRNAIKILGAQNRGMNPKDLGFKLRLPPMIISKYFQHLKGRSAIEFLDILDLCRDIDQKLKSSKISDKVMLASVVEALRH